MPFGPDMPIHERIQMLENALAKVLNRGGNMEVEPYGEPGTLAVYVLRKPWSNARDSYSLYTLAREMELLLT